MRTFEVEGGKREETSAHLQRIARIQHVTVTAPTYTSPANAMIPPVLSLLACAALASAAKLSLSGPRITVISSDGSTTRNEP